MANSNVRGLFNKREAPNPTRATTPPKPPEPPSVNWGQVVATTAVTALVSVAVIGAYTWFTTKAKEKLTNAKPNPPPPAPPPPTPPEARQVGPGPGQWMGGMVAPATMNPPYPHQGIPMVYPTVYPGAPLMMQPNGMPGMGQPPPHLRTSDSEAPEWFTDHARKTDRRMAKLEAALLDNDD